MTDAVRTRRRKRRLLAPAAAAAAAIAAGVAFLALAIFPSAPAAAAAVIPLHARAGSSASGLATARRATGGFSIQLTVRGLKKLAAGHFYECWYAGPANRPGHPQLISAGTFNVTSSGSETFSMWSAADPLKFKTMEITAESPGDAGQAGQVLLIGTARS